MVQLCSKVCSNAYCFRKEAQKSRPSVSNYDIDCGGKYIIIVDLGGDIFQGALTFLTSRSWTKQKLKLLQNYHLLMSFISGLNQAAISRLKWTRSKLHSKEAQVRGSRIPTFPHSLHSFRSFYSFFYYLFWFYFIICFDFILFLSCDFIFYFWFFYFIYSFWFYFISFFFLLDW